MTRGIRITLFFVLMGVLFGWGADGERFLQMYVEADGHCNFQPQLIGKAFDALRFWAAGGPRPAPGILQ